MNTQVIVSGISIAVDIVGILVTFLPDISTPKTKKRARTVLIIILIVLSGFLAISIASDQGGERISPTPSPQPTEMLSSVFATSAEMATQTANVPETLPSSQPASQNVQNNTFNQNANTINNYQANVMNFGDERSSDQATAALTSTTPSLRLTDSDYLAKDGVHIQNTDKDNVGNSYRLSITGGHEGWISYKLDKKYTLLTATAYLRYVERSDSSTEHIEIYGDDILIFTSKDFTARVEPENVSVDISGINQLKIIFFQTEGFGNLEKKLGLGDIVVN